MARALGCDGPGSAGCDGPDSEGCDGPGSATGNGSVSGRGDGLELSWPTKFLVSDSMGPCESELDTSSPEVNGSLMARIPYLNGRNYLSTSTGLTHSSLTLMGQVVLSTATNLTRGCLRPGLMVGSCLPGLAKQGQPLPSRAVLLSSTAHYLTLLTSLCYAARNHPSLITAGSLAQSPCSPCLLANHPTAPSPTGSAM